MRRSTYRLHLALKSRWTFVKYVQEFLGKLLKQVQCDRFVHIMKPVFTLRGLGNLKVEGTFFVKMINQRAIEIFSPPSATIDKPDVYRSKPPR